MAQHVTTLAEVREGMDPTDTPSNTDLIYAERGTGSDRARAFQVDEIAAKATETLGNGGDIAFSQYQAGGGLTRTKGDIQDGKILGKMLAVVIDMIVNGVGRTLQWVNEGFGKTELVWNGLRFYAPDAQSPDYRFDNDGNVRLGKLIFHFHSYQQAGSTRYAKMTDCEQACDSGVRDKVTEYLTISATNRPDFMLDSTRHEEGSVVMVTNMDPSVSIYCIPAWYTSDMGSYEANAIATIKPNDSKCFIFRRLNANNKPVWTNF